MFVTIFLNSNRKFLFIIIYIFLGLIGRLTQKQDNSVKAGCKKCGYSMYIYSSKV